MVLILKRENEIIIWLCSLVASETEAISDLTLEEKNELCPPKWTDIKGFNMMHGNLRQKSCSYRCAHRKKTSYGAAWKFARCKLTGDIDFENVSLKESTPAHVA